MTKSSDAMKIGRNHSATPKIRGPNHDPDPVDLLIELYEARLAIAKLCAALEGYAPHAADELRPVRERAVAGAAKIEDLWTSVGLKEIARQDEEETRREERRKSCAHNGGTRHYGSVRYGSGPLFCAGCGTEMTEEMQSEMEKRR